MVRIVKIVVYYENPDEQELAERIVPDVHAIAKFAADSTGNQFKANPIEITAHSEADFASARGYTIADLEAMKSVSNPAMGRGVIPGGASAQWQDLGTLGPGGIQMAKGEPGPGEPVYLGSNMVASKIYGVIAEPVDPAAMSATLTFYCGKCKEAYAGPGSCPKCLRDMAARTATPTPVLYPEDDA